LCPSGWRVFYWAFSAGARGKGGSLDRATGFASGRA